MSPLSPLADSSIADIVQLRKQISERISHFKSEVDTLSQGSALALRRSPEESNDPQKYISLTKLRQSKAFLDDLENCLDDPDQDGSDYEDMGAGGIIHVREKRIPGNFLQKK